MYLSNAKIWGGFELGIRNGNIRYGITFYVHQHFSARPQREVNMEMKFEMHVDNSLVGDWGYLSLLYRIRLYNKFLFQ